MKNELQELIKLYIDERNSFSWLISFEEFIKDYVVKCEDCGEFFVTDNNDKKCEECYKEYIESIKPVEQDRDWVYFEQNKEYFLYN